METNKIINSILTVLIYYFALSFIVIILSKILGIPLTEGIAITRSIIAMFLAYKYPLNIIK